MEMERTLQTPRCLGGKKENVGNRLDFESERENRKKG